MKRIAVLLTACFLALSLAAAGCGKSEDPRLLESERQLEGMYEACHTITIEDAQGEHPPITLEEIESREPMEVDAVLVRANGMAMEGTWTGVPVSDVLADHGVQMPFEELKIEAWDGYVARVPYEVAALPDTIFAYLENGEPLPVEDGPLRLVVASEDGYYWIRMINLIEVIR